MVLFRCEECGVIENSALSRYNTTRYNDEPNLCSECDPYIGKWHGKFKREFPEPIEEENTSSNLNKTKKVQNVGE